MSTPDRAKVSSCRTVADKLPVGAGSGREARLRLQEHGAQLSPTGETWGLSTPGWWVSHAAGRSV